MTIGAVETAGKLCYNEEKSEGVPLWRNFSARAACCGSSAVWPLPLLLLLLLLPGIIFSVEALIFNRIFVKYAAKEPPETECG